MSMKKLQASWEDLSSPLLELILELLPISDYLRFSSVCRSWRDVQRDHRLRNAASPRHKRQMPWLMFPIENNESPPQQRRRLFYSPSEQRYHRLPLPEQQGKRYCCGTSHGWLLLLDVDTKVQSDDTTWNARKTRLRNKIMLIIVNPLTGHQITLPVPVAMVPKCRGESRLDKPEGFLTSTPSDPDCVILLWDTYNWSVQLLCRVRENKWKWSKLRLPTHSAICCGSQFYKAGTYGKDLAVVDPVPDTPVVQEFLDMKGLPSYEGEWHSLAKSEGQILLTRTKWRKNMISEVSVYKADLLEKKWERLESLGDRVLFLSSAGGRMTSLSSIETGGAGNRIYISGKVSEWPEQSWIEYDYGSHQVISRNLSHQTQDSYQGSLPYADLLWIVPSL